MLEKLKLFGFSDLKLFSYFLGKKYLGNLIVVKWERQNIKHLKCVFTKYSCV